jgi:hypothetical protein
LGTPQSVAPPNHHFVGKLSPKRSDRIIPRYVYNEAGYAAHRLGSCVGSVAVHEDSAFVFRVFGRVDNERFVRRDSSDFRLKGKVTTSPIRET